MIVVDTNVVSEPMKTGGNPVVQTWLDCQIAETLCLTVTSPSERPAGIESLPAGRRKDGLGDALDDLLAGLFGGRILPFDQQAAVTYAAVVGCARAAGRAISIADGQIAAIAAVHGFTAPFDP